jgi:hypothetical protein
MGDAERRWDWALHRCLGWACWRPVAMMAAAVAGPTPASTLYPLFWAITERRRVLGGVVRQG